LVKLTITEKIVNVYSIQSPPYFPPLLFATIILNTANIFLALSPIPFQIEDVFNRFIILTQGKFCFFS